MMKKKGDIKGEKNSNIKDEKKSDTKGEKNGDIKDEKVDV